MVSAVNYGKPVQSRFYEEPPMTYTPALLPALIAAANETIAANAEQVTELDQAIGDGDHVVNLQRGLHALMEQREALTALTWPEAWQKIGMTLMSSIGGASGSLFGTLFVAMAKAAKDQTLDQPGFAAVFTSAVNAVKQRGKSEVGEKTMLDVLCPVAECLQAAAAEGMAMPELLIKVSDTAIAGMESTRDMLATKGRAAFLEERSRGHIDAGARTTQLMICAVLGILANA